MDCQDSVRFSPRLRTDGLGYGEHWFTIRNLFADKRCRQAVLDFLSTTDVERLVSAGVDAGSDASEWERGERREREEEGRAEAEELGAAGEFGAGEELPLFLPTPSFMASVDEDQRLGHGFACSSFCSVTLSLFPL